MRIKNVFLLLMVSLVSCAVFSQDSSRKNIVRVNVTNPLIFGSGAFVFGYERVISNKQSFSINLGRMSLPKFSNRSDSDTLKLIGNSGDKGFHISADYRFYLARENKYQAPRGIYIGPYYSYNYFKRSNEWALNSTSFNGAVNTDTRFDIHTFGVELGYQFIFWKRFSVDLIMVGPGVGIYNLKSGLNTNLSPEQEALFFEKLNGFLADKIPGYDLVIKEGEFSKNGSLKTTSLGYRYMINLGFAF